MVEVAVGLEVRRGEMMTDACGGGAVPSFCLYFSGGCEGGSISKRSFRN